MSVATEVIKKLLSDIRLFSRWVVGRELRKYQLEPARAIIDSVLCKKGLTFAVVMSRQAGKNEASAQLEAYLLNLFQRTGGFIVKAAPTYRPQTLNSQMRLEEVLDNAWNEGRWEGEEGYMMRLGKARVAFFSAQPQANVMGATANILLECDEAQDVPEEKWNKDFKPMGASTNVTTVLWGTAWTSKTLLAKTVRALHGLEEQDGIRRVFFTPWEVVARENAAYGEYVRGEIQRLGRNHPFIKTQYFLEEIDAEGGMFPASRQAQMKGEHQGYPSGKAELSYALFIDVAGEDEVLEGEELRALAPGKDSTALTVVEIDLSTVADPYILKPTYRVVHRKLWTGTKHTKLYAQLVDLAVNVWRAKYVVVDATGVGAGLASFLGKALGERCIPFIFSAKTKSDLGWDFLAICDSGRFKDMLDDDSEEYRHFWRQVEEADYEILEGPSKQMRWGVKDRAVHDDLLISGALCAVLDRLDWAPAAQGRVVAGREKYRDGRY